MGAIAPLRRGHPPQTCSLCGRRYRHLEAAMSIGAIGYGVSQLANIQRSYQQVRGEFQNLGQDLQGGNLAQAQTDFVTLSATVSTQYGANSAVSKSLSSVG